ncbi:FecR protein [Planctomycetes bacterium CA13]|uniref:FecR protein n=1 Tax=Novipirellula herctigrandis TaxID=2527986 RepID=A0A5C5Z4R8_9BACT|nr:FecR protein [Planctomycetes bacterium CA13]
MKDRESIHQYLLGKTDKDGVAHLNEKLCADDDFRKLFANQLVLDCNLRDVAGLRQADVPISANTGWGQHLIRWPVIVTLAASLLLVVGWILFSSPPARVATLVSSEDAAWVSDLPTSVGSELPAGELQLISGIATLRFDSGATMILEAPARLELQTDMRAFLHDGSAVLEVSESAIGFVVTTPSGDAIDLGTSFAVNVDGAKATSEFEVLKGSISVGMSNQCKRVLLKDNEAVFVDCFGISEASTAEYTGNTKQMKPRFRIGTDGNEATFVRGGTSAGASQLLMVKSSWKNNLYDRKAVFSFDASGVEIASAVAIRLRLNQVESEIGFANRLPPINVFQVYAVPNIPQASWDRGSTWDETPSPDVGVLVGEFKIPRSRKSGECVLETNELAEFVRSHRDGPLTFVVVRETKQIPGDGRVLVHTFASHSHPSAVGPTLEFDIIDE